MSPHKKYQHYFVMLIYFTLFQIICQQFLVNLLNKQFEINAETGEIRSNIFYCYAQMPSQKPHVENNHEFIRDIILKKKSMSNLTQDKLDLMFSHINSVPRKPLGGKTPYEAFEFFYGKDTLDKFNIQKIKEDEVTLQPYLLQL